jgi:hypothetical protein
MWHFVLCQERGTTIRVVPAALAPDLICIACVTKRRNQGIGHNIKKYFYINFLKIGD